MLPPSHLPPFACFLCAQTDWEAILSPSREHFTSRLSPWMYPALKEAPYLASIPDVADVFPSIGTVFEILSQVR